MASKLSVMSIVCSLVVCGFAYAQDVATEVKIVDDLEGIESQDVFFIDDLSFSAPSSILAQVSTAGGCEDHKYTLYLSRAVKESYPPVAEAFIVLDKAGDTCKRIVEAEVEFDISGFEYSGVHFVDVYSGLEPIRVLADINSDVEPTASRSLDIVKGRPDSFGDPLSIEAAEVISGIDGYFARIAVSYEGGCQDHSYEAWWDGTYMKSLPPRVAIILVHDANDDPCKALVSDELEIKIDQVTGQGAVYLDFFGLDGSRQTARFPPENN